jgi:hypothetical protein
LKVKKSPKVPNWGSLTVLQAALHSAITTSVTVGLRGVPFPGNPVRVVLRVVPVPRESTRGPENRSRRGTG